MLCVLAKSWSSVRSITWLFMSQIPFALFAFYYNTHVLLFSEKKEKKRKKLLAAASGTFQPPKNVYICTNTYVCIYTFGISFKILAFTRFSEILKSDPWPWVLRSLRFEIFWDFYYIEILQKRMDCIELDMCLFFFFSLNATLHFYNIL